MKPVALVLDSNLTKAAKMFKNRQCSFAESGCKAELEVKHLVEHEKTCEFRSITCPYLNCKKPGVLYSNLIEHYFTHPNVLSKSDVLAFNGTIGKSGMLSKKIAMGIGKMCNPIFRISCFKHLHYELFRQTIFSPIHDQWQSIARLGHCSRIQ